MAMKEFKKRPLKKEYGEMDIQRFYWNFTKKASMIVL